MARKDSRAITRNKDGLMPAQQEFLQKYAETGSESEARAALTLKPSRVRHWMREDEAFKAAFATAVSGIHEAVALKLKVQEEKLPEAIEELLNAEKTKEVTCPCGCKYKFPVVVMDAATRAKMVQMMMKSQGHLKEVHRVEGGLTVTELPFDVSMALSMHNNGKQISEASRRKLVQLGLIEDTPPDRIIIEGESRRLDE